MWGYLDGSWAFLRWPEHWDCDNMAVVSILNNKSSKNDHVMSLLRKIVYWTLMGNFQFKATHIASSENKIADALSRGQFQRFREVAKGAKERPHQIPQEFLELLI